MLLAPLLGPQVVLLLVPLPAVQVGADLALVYMPLLPYQMLLLRTLLGLRLVLLLVPQPAGYMPLLQQRMQLLRPLLGPRLVPLLVPRLVPQQGLRLAVWVVPQKVPRPRVLVPLLVPLLVPVLGLRGLLLPPRLLLLRLLLIQDLSIRPRMFPRALIQLVSMKHSMRLMLASIPMPMIQSLIALVAPTPMLQLLSM
jgi:hypothetical protein